MRFVLTKVFMCLALVACGGDDSVFRVGELPSLTEDADLVALHERRPQAPLPSQPTVNIHPNDGSELLYSPRPEVSLIALDQGLLVYKEPRSIDLSLFDAVLLGVRQNRDIESAYLQRVSERFALYVAEEAFVPKFDTFTSSLSTDGEKSDYGGEFSLGSDFIWSSPYGTSFTADWSSSQDFNNDDDVEGRGNSSVSFEFTQPLLQGAGFDVATAPLRLARIGEQQNQLALRSTVIDSITSIISAYLTYVGQTRAVTIARQNLERSRELLQSNRIQISAGRMAANEVIQTELSVSNSELALQQALDAQDSARLQLLNLLALDPELEINESLQFGSKLLTINADQASVFARFNNPSFLSQELTIEQAQTALLVTRDNLRWSLDVSAGYIQRGDDDNLRRSLINISNEAGGWNTGLTLTIPLNTNDLELAETQAEVALRQSEVALEQARESLETQVRDVVNSVDETWQALQISKRSRELAVRTLEVEQRKLEVGRTTNFEVLARQLSLLDAEVAELNNEISYLLALATLDQVLGTTLETWGITINER